jgi:SAM-dependent methyltransferase
MENESYYAYLTNRSRLSFAVRKQLFINSLVAAFHGRVLDVGCGIGEFLQAYPGESVGVDVNPLLVQYCQNQGFPGAVAGAYQLPFAAESFDGVLIYHVLEHLPDWHTAVAEAVRVLRPDGVLVTAVPMAAGFRHDDTHIHLLKTADFQKAAAQHGLHVRQIKPHPAGAQWLGNHLYICELRSIFVKNSSTSS